MKVSVEEFQDVKLHRGTFVLDRFVNYSKTITEDKEGKKSVSYENYTIKRSDVCDNRKIDRLWYLEEWSSVEMRQILDYYLSKKKDK